MRTLRQPGPIHPRRIESFGVGASVLTFPMRTGVSFLEAATGPLVGAGWRGGTLTFAGGAFEPFRYVMPGPPDNDTHVAYFSAARQSPGAVQIPSRRMQRLDGTTVDHSCTATRHGQRRMAHAEADTF